MSRALQAELEELGLEQLRDDWHHALRLLWLLELRLEQAVTLASTCPGGGVIQGGQRETSGSAAERGVDFVDEVAGILGHLTGEAHRTNPRCPWCERLGS